MGLPSCQKPITGLLAPLMGTDDRAVDQVGSEAPDEHADDSQRDAGRKVSGDEEPRCGERQPRARRLLDGQAGEDAAAHCERKQRDRREKPLEVEGRERAQELLRRDPHVVEEALALRRPGAPCEVEERDVKHELDDKGEADREPVLLGEVDGGREALDGRHRPVGCHAAVSGEPAEQSGDALVDDQVDGVDRVAGEVVEDIGGGVDPHHDQAQAAQAADDAAGATKSVAEGAECREQRHR